MRISLLMLVLFFVGTSAAFAQEDAAITISGKVRSASANAKLDGLVVELRQDDTVVTSTETDADGAFGFAAAAGDYSVAVGGEGLAESVVPVSYDGETSAFVVVNTAAGRQDQVTILFDPADTTVDLTFTGTHPSSPLEFDDVEDGKTVTVPAATWTITGVELRPYRLEMDLENARNYNVTINAEPIDVSTEASCLCTTTATPGALGSMFLFVIGLFVLRRKTC